MPTIKKYQESNKNAEYAYKYYLNIGYTPEQSSAIVGNLLRESNLNPTAVGDNGKAFGLAQWHPDRQAKAKGLYGEKWKDFDNQLEFVHWELNNTEKPAGDALKKTKSVWEAGRVFTNSYERPKLKFDQDETRQTHVADVYRNYAKMQLTEEDKNKFKPTFAKDVAPYMNQPATNGVTDFDIPIDNRNFASVPDVPQREEQTKTEEALNTLKEKEFVKQYKSFFTEQKAPEQQEQPQQVIQPTDVQGIFNEVNQFVDNPMQQGGEVDMYGNPILSSKKINPNTDRSYYDSRTNQMNIGTDYNTWVKEQGLQEDLIAHENYHAKQSKEGRDNFDIAHNTDNKFWAEMQKPPQLPTTDDVYYNFHNRKDLENYVGVEELKKNIPENIFLPNTFYDLAFDKKVDEDLYNNPYSMEGETMYYTQTGEDFYKQQGGEKKPLSYLQIKLGKSKDDFNFTYKGQNLNIELPSTKQETTTLREKQRPLQQIQPQGIVNQTQNIEAPIPNITSQAQIPKSFDIEYSAQRMNGGTGYYDQNNVQNVDLETALRAQEQEDRMNQYWQEKYGNSQNPKAKERLEQLKDSVKITPNYQQGGIPISRDGVYDYPGQEVIVPTTDGRITMSKVTYPILGIDEYGNSQMMMPGEEYQFKGKTIHEHPQLTDKEKAFLKALNRK